MAPSSPSDVPIRPAATVVLVRRGTAAVEVLMVRRNRDAVFMGGAHVFPGGGVDVTDDSPVARAAIRWSGDDEEFPWRAAALRELFEEAGVLLGSDHSIDPSLRGPAVFEALVADGVVLDADALEYFANWVTPLGPPRRYNARFYVAQASVDAVTDNSEVFDAEWVEPQLALDLAARGEWQLEIPTRAALETISAHRTPDAVMRAAAAVEVRTIAPRVVTDDDGAIRVLLPGDHGFEEAPA